MLAKHIIIARNEGVEAGLDAYMHAPSSRLHPNYKALKACRTDATRLKKYREFYLDQIGVIKTPFNGGQDATQEIAEAAVAPSVQDLFAAFMNFVQTQGITTEAPVATEKATTRKRTGTKAHVVTNRDAWIMLGSNPKFKRIANDRPASPGLLYRANLDGCFERVYTKGDAWAATGSVKKFEPNDKKAPASGNALSRMNKAGLIR